MRARVGWPDVAKGVCIILVVLWHVVTKHAIEVKGAGPITDAWATLNAQLLPLRMPLFFLISGMFAGSAVNAPAGSSWRRRAGRLAAVYVIWVVIQTFVLALTPDFDTARAENGWQLLAQLTISPTNLWYLLALAVYLVVARLLRHVSTTVVLPIAFVIAAVAAAGLIPDLGNLWQLVQNLFFFLAGLRLRPMIERFAAASGPLRTLMLGAAYVAAVGAVGVLGMRQWPGVWPFLAVVAVTFGVAAYAVLDRHAGAIARPLRWIGQRTLPIYVIHMIPLALIDGALRGAGWVTTPAFEVVWPIVLTGVVIAICLAVHAALVRIGLGVLFDPLLLVDRVAAARMPG
ncbi:acyltransferase family protein [Microbacterium phyllosphaerae]|uniref:acyltransferase family protein n=1 Tax=Microbacterium phyllosphaerae TaxID=124798 RepID=UPI002169A80D|nr:acyltransferase family protein [Microbacterium phyllosphaerae]MCS3442754.1 putative membrane protein YcfT [Microbacterium phyllosphaerae]